MVQIEELNPENISMVRCSLKEVTLDDPGLEYQALSYVWGEETPSSQILADDKTLAVTANLEDALRHLRTNRLYCCDRLCSCYSDDADPVPLNYEFTFPTLLWIDAICINQKDNEERTQQVALMREIFSRASQVVAWLGSASEHTVPAFRLLFGLACLYDCETDIAEEYVSHLVRHESFQGHWLALGELLEREWWKRAWIIQEITLASQALLVCGPYATDWERVRKATATFNSCTTYMDEILEATVSSGQPEHFFSFRGGAARMTLLRLLRFEKWERPYLPAAQTSREQAFTNLLIMAKNYQSKYKVDKVYAVLGLSEELDGRQPLRADYTRSVCNVYMETARIIFENLGCLEFLNCVEKKRGISSHNSGLPSWTPDWTVPSSQDSVLPGGRHLAKWSSQNARSHAHMEEFSFTSGSIARCDFSFDAKTITVNGFVVGTIRETHRRFYDVEPNIRFENVKRFVKRIVWSPPSESETLERHSYWLRWLGFQSSFPRTQTIEASDERRHPDRAEAMDTTKCFAINGEKSRYLACSDGSIQPGDVVCALFGGNMPYVLRQKGASWLFISQWRVIFEFICV